jgi:hypothetical protein
MPRLQAFKFYWQETIWKATSFPGNQQAKVCNYQGSLASGSRKSGPSVLSQGAAEVSSKLLTSEIFPDHTDGQGW